MKTIFLRTTRDNNLVAIVALSLLSAGPAYSSQMGLNKLVASPESQMGLNKLTAAPASQMGLNKLTSTPASQMGLNKVAAEPASQMGLNKLTSTPASQMGLNSASVGRATIKRIDECESPNFMGECERL